MLFFFPQEKIPLNCTSLFRNPKVDIPVSWLDFFVLRHKKLSTYFLVGFNNITRMAPYQAFSYLFYLNYFDFLDSALDD
jgi:hypothetical protein